MRKRSIVATALAVLLVTVLIIGGSTLANGVEPAALTGSTALALNTVSLTETAGTTYELIPGTSQEQDPTVNVCYTSDAYVFVQVEDTSGGLITWSPADGWNLLSESKDTEGMVTSVYYRLVDENCGTNTTVDSTPCYIAGFSILEGDQISYSSSIGNDDTIEKEPLPDGTGVVLKSTNMSLTFQTYLAQYISTLDVQNAWLLASGEAVAVNETTGAVYTTLAEAVSSASNEDIVSLVADVSENITFKSAIKVTLDLSGHTLTGTDPDTSGGTILIRDGADVTIISSGSTGTITGDSVGIHLRSKGTVSVKNVTISDNVGAGIATTGSSGAGNAMTITLMDTTVSGNSVGLNIDKYGSATIESDTVIQNNTGGGVSNGGTLTLTDGTITSNGAEGVYNAGTFTMNGGTITQNTGANGTAGGVRNTGTFTMSGGSITENNGKAGAGGIRNTGTFEMTGGTISKNSGIYGGVFSRGSVTMSGGTVTGNSATSGGGGVYVYEGTFSVSGSPSVTDNTLNGKTNNVQLNSGIVITLTGELTSSADIAVTTNTKPTSDSSVQITAMESSTTYYSNASGYIRSDNDSYKVSANEGSRYLELEINNP